jgi:hypothetical protein
MGVYQGPSSNVTIVGSGGSPKAVVDANGGLDVNILSSGAGSDPVLLGTYTAGSADDLIPNAQRYRQLLVYLTLNTNTPNIENLLLENVPAGTAKRLPYYELSQPAEIQFQFNRYFRNGDEYNVTMGSGGNVAILLYENASVGGVAISYINNTDVTITVFGIDFDINQVSTDAPALPFLSSANQAGIQTLSIPDDESFISPASQYAKNVTISTVGAPGAIAFSYNGGTDFMEIPANSLYTIAGFQYDLANLSFAYITGGATYDLKLNWEN